MTGRKPIPYRITTALDMADLHGPEVDAALGVPEPTVDLWEEGKLVPTGDQLERLAELTGFAVEYFFRERPPQSEEGAMFLCRRGRGGCEVIDPRPAAEVIELHGQATLW